MPLRSLKLLHQTVKEEMHLVDLNIWFKNIFYSDNVHVARYIQCQYTEDLTVSFKLICEPFLTQTVYTTYVNSI